jgi:monoamine oxidase
LTDVIVIGAGAAGLGAARRLAAAGVDVLVLEAGPRIGGRAHTLVGHSGLAIDLGCGWLHSADRNPLTALVEPLGLTLDTAAPSWTKPALTVNFSAEDQRAYRKVFEAFERRLRAAADEAADQPAAALFGPDERPWIPLLNAFSGYYNGAPFDEISVKDYAAYQPTERNWRVAEGYGALIARLGAGLDVRTSHAVSRIAWRPDGVRVGGARGEVEALAAIVCVPATVLAGQGVQFDPPLHDKIEAAAALPLGHVEKAFLRLSTPEEFPEEARVHGRIDTADTAAYSLRPLGRPIIECFFGGDLAASLELETAGAFTAFALDELCALFGSAFRARAAPIAESRWRADPFIGGAYSHALVGHADARERLSEPVGARLRFAGEACSPHAFSTAHGAYETGVAAANAVLQALGRETEAPP